MLNKKDLVIRTNKKTALILLVFTHISSHAKVRILYTAALVQNDFKTREKEYIKSLKILNKYGYNPYIVEAIQGKGPSFLDNYSDRVFYSKKHDFGIKSIKNKGINEAKTMLDALHYFNFDDNDIIIKITGRYFLENNSFLKFVEKNSQQDVIIKTIYNKSFRSRDNPDGIWPITGLFAMRCKYLKEMLINLDYEYMEKHFSYIEAEMFKFLSKNSKRIKITYSKDLNLVARVIGDGRPSLVRL